MASFFLQKWATVLGNAVQSLKFMPHRARMQPVADLEELADLLSHIERQMNRARLAHLGHRMSLAQFLALWRHKLQEIDLLLRKAALPGRLQRSLLAERVRRTLNDWEQAVLVAWSRSPQPAQLRELQHRLEDLVDALLIYARAKHEQWSDTQPTA